MMGADIDGVAGFEHMLDRRMLATVTNDGDSGAPAKVAGEIGQSRFGRDRVQGLHPAKSCPRIP